MSFLLLPLRLIHVLWKHKGKTILALVILVPFALLLWYIFAPAKPQYLTAVSRRGELIQRAEAVGTVISDRDVALKFPVTGVVSAVLVREGNKVKTGQELARLKNDALAAAVASASARVASLQATLKELKEGSRPEDIAIVEADVANKRAALEAAKATLATAEEKLQAAERKIESIRNAALTSLKGETDSTLSTISSQLTDAHGALDALENIFVADYTVRYLAQQVANSSFIMLESGRSAALKAINLEQQTLPPAFLDHNEALSKLRSARSAAALVPPILERAYQILEQLPVDTGLTRTSKETYKSTVTTEKDSAQTVLAALDATIKDLLDAAASYDTDISTEEVTLATAQGVKTAALSDIQTYEASLRSQEASLALKRAGTRQTSIDVAQANVAQAAADLKRAQAQYEDSILRAPMDGTITKVDFRVGEFTGDAANATHTIALLGLSPYRIEMFLSEVDIPKIQITQSGSVDLDAFPGTTFKLHVNEIESASTLVEGVAKYRVKLDFVYPHDDLKIGMTGDAGIVTATASGVVLIPARAVLSEQGRTYVRVLNDPEATAFEERDIETGLEGDTDIVVKSGLEEGETVIILIK
ncbi:MAG: efflux RND transporter periplasmic adaptor subunit [Candidatus Peregrinibacteria bacterium]